MYLDQEALQQIIWNIEHVGTPQSVSTKLIEKSSNDLSDCDLAEMISQDPTVSAQILKVANSVHFSQGRSIKTITQAVVHLGTTNVKRILFAVELLGVFHGHLSNEKFDEKDFWKHSLAGAIIASRYADLHLSVDTELVYSAALIRDLGVLVIRQYIPSDFNVAIMLIESKKMPFSKASKSVVGVTHRHLGYMLGLRWNLPKLIIEAIDDQVNPHDISQETQQIRKAIRFADDLLRLTEYAVWDPHYTLGNVEFQGIPCREIFNETTTMVDEVFKEFWK